MKKSQLKNIIKEEIRQVLLEMSIPIIKKRIFEVLESPQAEKYRVDNFNFENIPLELFEENGLTEFHLKQYENSNDIITFDLGINLDPIKKTADVFLQQKGIFS